MRSIHLITLSFSVVFFISCAQTQEPPQPTQQPITIVNVPSSEAAKDTVVALPKKIYDNRFNNVSGILSGVRDSLNPLKYLYDIAIWRENKMFIDNSWKKLDKNRLKPMQKWSSKELVAANKDSKTVFYPFSGPDFLTANAFFPKAETLIMLGLEPIGSLPKIDEMDTVQARAYCEDFKRSLSDIFEKSYFITSYMLRDFKKEEVNGLLPVLCFFVKRTGYQITDIKYLVKHNQDTIMEVPYETKEKFFGVKVSCEKNDTLKTVYYFKYDVSNQQFNDSCAFYRFVNRNTKNAITYIKSGSYLLHANFMSNLRKLIMRNSNYVLQDDTGIPYSYFEKDKSWTTKLYGKYIQPVKDFPYLKMQEGIVKAFEKDSANIPDIPFHLGYHWQQKKDLLIYAAKK